MFRDVGSGQCLLNGSPFWVYPHKGHRESKGVVESTTGCSAADTRRLRLCPP